MTAVSQGARPEQAALTRDNALSKTAQSCGVIEALVDSLNDHVIEGQEAYWHPDARWIGSGGCGVKPNLKAFQDGWQRPFLNAFSDKVCVDEARIAETACRAFTPFSIAGPSPRP